MEMYKTVNNWFVCYNVTEKDKNKYKLTVYGYNPHTDETKIYKVKTNNMGKVMRILTGIICDFEFEFNKYEIYLCKTKTKQEIPIEGQMMFENFEEEM